MNHDFGGLPVYVSDQLPMRSTKPGPMKLSPFVTVSDEMRAKMDAWMRDFFGDTHYPQPVLVHGLRGFGMIFVSRQMHAELRRAIPERDSPMKRDRT